jgi:hypothetical protein
MQASVSPESSFQSLSQQEQGLRSRSTAIIRYGGKNQGKSESEFDAKMKSKSMDDIGFIGLRSRRNSILTSPDQESASVFVPYGMHANEAERLRVLESPSMSYGEQAPCILVS